MVEVVVEVSSWSWDLSLSSTTIPGGWWLDKTKLILISTQVEDVVEDWSEKVLKINFHCWVGVGGWVAGSSGNKAISAFNWVEVEV